MSYLTFNSAEAVRWYDYYNLLDPNFQDIYFTPEYCEVYEKNGEGEAVLFIYQEGEKFVYYPFLKRKLSKLTHLSLLKYYLNDFFDITTPYGYGGPLTNKPVDEQFLKNFNEQFRQYCDDMNIITEFVRFHPLMQNHSLYKEVKPACIRKTVYIDLTLDYSEIWINYDSKNRNRIKKSKTYDLEIRHRQTNDLDDFLTLYYSTMNRNDADYYYYFSREFFNNTSYLLNEKLELVEVLHKGVTIFSCFIMYSRNYLHYHLSGSNKDYQSYASNNFLIDYLVQWGKEKGIKYFHLGGGYSGDDSLYSFKKKFNKNGDLSFFIGRKIHNTEVYNKIVNECKYVKGDYFPQYRHPDLLSDDKLSQTIN
ncbi:GNAT family N-acetyltransferase [Metabacillus idriensis]|uniref:GNAT family N-acetyltransferase n=1 Tax=Metabacillus idriensis TaxID=324768 RepID=A0A6I2MA87_9BACI|nr:GNAT family N-acetyltransferase [Metabacillus idriensis]MCM3598330.1 GNAT family N-acetyltransferase [Metabacillus idriensis]MRX55048.1 GNAT family N-acetyltransferase [Metabacillus idriensis]OHR71604.1 hypothetical protein HMPREF3291_23945 [Bacillus sp. HMSC76G11]